MDSSTARYSNGFEVTYPLKNRVEQMENVTDRLVSPIVQEYRRSNFMKLWRKLWKWFPGFSAKHSAVFLFSDGCVLWNQGFGKIAFLKGDRSVTVRWGLGDRKVANIIIYLSDAQRWDPPHEDEQLSVTERENLGERFRQCYQSRNETVVLR
jgi:hypothetical protein